MISGAGGGIGGKIYKWKRYELNSKTIYTWDKWNSVSTTTYKWNKWSYNLNLGEKRTDYDEYQYMDIGGSTIKCCYESDSRTSFLRDGRDCFGIEKLFDVFLSNGLGSGFSGAYMWASNVYESDSYYTYTGTLYKIEGTQRLSLSPERYRLYYTYFVQPTHSYSIGSTYYGEVTSTNSSAYPSNGKSGSYWYVSAGSETIYSKGDTSYGKVESESSSAYPNGGAQSGYWYENRTSRLEYSMGAYKDSVYSTTRNQYPDNGHDASYWYVFDGES